MAPLMDVKEYSLPSIKPHYVDQNVVWTPSKVIHRLGKEIQNEESIYYWAYKVRQVSCDKRTMI
jgi:deoxyhypusine synthase